MFVKLERAIEVVIELAQQNVLGEEYIQGDLGLREERDEQLESIKVVEDHFVNNVWG